jgi:hypothetical protein
MKKLNQNKSDFLDEMIDHWLDDETINQETANRLRASYDTKNFDWKRLAQYSFWIAILCGLLSLSAVLVDKSILTYLKAIYDTPDIVISILSALIAAMCYIYGFRRKKRSPQTIFSNEALVLSGVILTANAIAYLGKTFDDGSNHFSLLILLSVIIYLVLAERFRSRLIWAFGLLALGAWFGTETGYLSQWNWYFIGLNYPLRFVLFGLTLTIAAWMIKKRKSVSYFFDITYFAGLLYLFISLLLLSIFGNYETITAWYNVKQITLFHWALISTAVCAASIWIGLKFKDTMLREFGLTFLFINIYTRYFEYFWDSLHKALFFVILAISFVLIGRKAEKIWNFELPKP